MGPTAAGKTASAIQLVERFPLEIISVDSALIYKEMDIGTAKPDTKTLAKAPHRLISFLDPKESYSVAVFCEQAKQAIAEIHDKGKIPLLVGGTMMYYRALQNGLAELPEADAEIRTKIEAEAKDLGWQAIHDQLKIVDAASAARIHPNDPQRIQRALEVFLISGVPLSQLLKISQSKAFKYDSLKLVIGPEQRRQLDASIALRFQAMLDAGFLEEVETLQRRGDLNLELASMRCVGYRQAWKYLLGELSKKEMIEQTIKATEQLAKRQYTWLKSEAERHWYDSDQTRVSSLSGECSLQLRSNNLFDLVEKYCEIDSS